MIIHYGYKIKIFQLQKEFFIIFNCFSNSSDMSDWGEPFYND
jgi:hypothetical protein